MTLTVVYDNNAYDERLRTAWGFACMVRRGSSTVLFDTGGDGKLLLSNMVTLGLDPLQIDAVVLSHVHADHTGGLAAVLDTGARPVAWVPPAFPASFRSRVRERTKLVEVAGPVEVLPGIYSSGQLGADIGEQALVVQTGPDLLIVTGCAHPGVVQIVRRCIESFGAQVSWVVGGFHLGGASRSQIASIIEELRRLGVQKIGPCHCTGNRATRMLEQAFGSACVPAGVGWSVSISTRE